MKRLITLSLLLMTTLAIAEEVISINGIDEPQWKDFAPVAYREVNEPKGLAKFNDVTAYWYKRKVEFDNNIEKCREIYENDAKFACYQDLKIKQYQKNSDYNARIEAMERAKMYPQEIQNPTSNMLPINQYINNFGRFQPNEFN